MKMNLQQMQAIDKIADPVIQHLVNMLAQFSAKQPLVATETRWLMAEKENGDDPDLDAGQILILESIDVDSRLFYPPFGHEDIEFIADNVDPSTDGINVYYWGSEELGDTTIGLRFQDAALPIVLPAELQGE